jgi:hypothetical protein
MKRTLILGSIMATALLIFVAVLTYNQPLTPITYADLPTSIPPNQVSGTTGDICSKENGCAFLDAIGIVGKRDVQQLTIMENAAQTAVPFSIENSKGTPIARISSDAMTNIGLPSVKKVHITYASDSMTSTLATVPTGYYWIVEHVYAKVTTNFDCAGNDCALNVGDQTDADGYLVLNDAALQAAAVEGTGWLAGWQGQQGAAAGVYQDSQTSTNGANGHIQTAANTITAAGSGTTMNAGAADIYIFYTQLPQ